MIYAGGKHRAGARIARWVSQFRASGQLYVEPFLGGANVMWRVGGPRAGADVDLRIIRLWRALSGGWQPGPISRQRYAGLRERMDLTDPETLYAGYCCSNRGRWFNGFKNAKSGDSWGNIARQLPSMAGVWLACADYRGLRVRGAVVYCDPPYRGVGKYPGLEPFDSEEFWTVARGWARDNTVLVTERAAPEGVELLETFTRRGSNAMVEHLWRVGAD